MEKTRAEEITVWRCRKCHGPASDNRSPAGNHFCDEPCEWPAPPGEPVPYLSAAAVREAEQKLEEAREQNMSDACDECADREEAAVARAERAEAQIARLREWVKARPQTPEPEAGSYEHGVTFTCSMILSLLDNPVQEEPGDFSSEDFRVEQLGGDVPAQRKRRRS